MEDFDNWLEQELQGKVRDETLRHFIMSGAQLVAKAYKKGFEDGMTFVSDSPSGGGASEQV